jgi:type II secretory pathway pseudopilin PulG
MKLHCSKSRTLRGCRAFTLVEVMISSVCIIILIGSVIMCNLFGLAMATRQQIWLGASDDAAKAIGTLIVDIRSANTLYVGTYTNSAWAQTALTNQQSGNALLIYTATNSTYAAGPWTLYYYDPTSNNLVRTNFYGAGSNGDYKLVSANPITNDNTHRIFTELDTSGTGTPISNYTTLAPISVYLSFTELQNPQIEIENGSLVDLYQVTTTVTPRLLLQ